MLSPFPRSNECRQIPKSFDHVIWKEIDESNLLLARSGDCRQYKPGRLMEAD